MDKAVDITDFGARIDTVASRPAEVPVNGFEWVQGERVLSKDFSAPGLFLVPRPGSLRAVSPTRRSIPTMF